MYQGKTEVCFAPNYFYNMQEKEVQRYIHFFLWNISNSKPNIERPKFYTSVSNFKVVSVGLSQINLY